jgi:negative regulator of genetic competence, sporulation and motility
MILCALILSIGLVGSTFAHKSQVVGEYKLEVGWEKEPPIAGKQNTIEIIITRATASDMNMSEEEHAKHQKESSSKKETKSTKKTTDSKTKSEKKTTVKELKPTKKTETKKTTTKKKASSVTGITGLEVAVNLNDKKTFLEMKEDKKTPGRYYGAFTPDKEGHPTVHVYGKIERSDVEATLHPEKVEAAKSK